MFHNFSNCTHKQFTSLDILMIIKQDILIYIYVVYSRPNGWTDWADFFCGHSWVAGECYRLKKLEFFDPKYFFQKFYFNFFYGQRRTL